MQGPFTRTTKVTDVNHVPFYRTQTWYRQDKGAKVRLPLPYKCLNMIQISGVNNKNGMMFSHAQNCLTRQYLDLSWGRSNVTAYGNTIESLHNKCYGKFLDKVRTAPQIGVDLAEYKQTLSMVRSTLSALRKPLQTFANAWNTYMRAFTQKGSVRNWRKNPVLKDAPNAWLAFHFGVEPLIKDLHDLLERLNEPPKAALVSKTSKQTLEYRSKAYGQTIHETYRQHVRIAAHVKRKDETLSLVNDMGLINPLSITWELVPFSFVVDWFYPVGSYLNSLTDLLGYDIQNPYRTWYVTAIGSHTFGAGAVLPTDPCIGIPYVNEGFRMERAIGLPAMVSQYVRLPTSLSPSRAATQVSLLLQILTNDTWKYYSTVKPTSKWR